MKLNELDSQLSEFGLSSIPKAKKIISKGVDWVGKKLNKADDTPRVEPDFDPAMLPKVDKPKIKMQPGETQDQAMARVNAERAAANKTSEPVTKSIPVTGTDVKNYKRGFKDRVADKLTKREPGVTTVTPSPEIKLPANVDVPPKMRKPAPETPAVKAADEVPAVKAVDDAPSIADTEKQTLLRRGADWTGDAIKRTAIKHPIYTAGATAAGVTAADAKLSSMTNDTTFGSELGKNLGLGAKSTNDAEGEVGVPASSSANAPESDPDFIPPAPARQDESLATLLKLTGQRPITERDNTMGIIKPKAIQTLTENAVNECGMGMMGSPSSTPASLSINATAGSGEEVANMLASIMKLAGVRPVEQDMMPAQNSNMPMMKALQIMGGPDDHMEPSAPDSMNANLGADEIDLEVGSDSQSDGDGSVTVRNVDTGEEHVGRDVTEPGSITVRNVDTGEEFKGKESTAEDQSDIFKASTTPQDPTDVPKFDSNKMADMRNYIDMAQIPAGAPGDNRLPKEEPKLQESSLGLDLFKAYEAFKNQ